MTYDAELNRKDRFTSRYSLTQIRCRWPSHGFFSTGPGAPVNHPSGKCRYGQTRGPLSYQLLDDGDSPTLPPLSCDLWDVKSKTMTERQQRTPVVFDIVCLVTFFHADK